MQSLNHGQPENLAECQGGRIPLPFSKTFRSLQKLGAKQRPLCLLLKKAAKGNLVFPFGLCLAMQLGDDFTLASTFGGLKYFLPQTELAANFVINALRAATKEPTARVEADVLLKYDATAVEIISVTAQNGAQFLDDVPPNDNFPFNRTEFLKRLAGGVEVTELPRSLVRMTHRTAAAIARARESPSTSDNALQIAFLGGMRETADQVMLLRALLHSLNLPAYHEGWRGKRIELSDKYYDLPSHGARPAQPKNWHCPLEGT